MAALKRINLFQATSIYHQRLRNFHLNPIMNDKNWRIQRKLTVNPNAFGPLTNLPDYSFKDGRPVPYGSHQKRRIDQQREHLLRIKELVSEVDMAVMKHKSKLEAIENEKQRILGRKLKEKGEKLLLSTGSETLEISDGESRKEESKHSTDDSKNSS